MKWGPAGDIYLIDWHDQNPCHQTNPDDWDYERGRIYRIQLKGYEDEEGRGSEQTFSSSRSWPVPLLSKKNPLPSPGRRYALLHETS